MKSVITFCGGVGAVTGANFLLEVQDVPKNTRIIVDCGLLQGVQHADRFNESVFPYDATTIDMLFITHAHADHIGRVPKLIKEGFTGVIYSTPATLDLTKVMLEDQCQLIEREAMQKGVLPMYDKKDMMKALSLWRTIEYHVEQEVAPGIKVYLKDAGHILGSAMVELTRNGRKIVFTGDLGNSPSLFLRDTEAITDANYMIMESVYGDRNHGSKEARHQHLTDIVKKTIAGKKTLVIPVFSLERTQDILFELNELVETKQIDPLPVFIDSPLGIKVTEIYRQYEEEFKPEIQERIRKGDDIFDFTKLKLTARPEESSKIFGTSNPKIVMAGSGMSSGGRIVYHEMQYLPDPQAIIMFVGYQSVGTLGRVIQEGAREVLIRNEKIAVRADIESIDGYSSHKDSDHLIEFVDGSAETLDKVFVAMGEPKSAMFLAQRLRDYVGVKAIYPELKSEYELEF